MNTALHAILHPVRTLWQHWSAGSWRRLPRPVDDPVVHTPGPDADRLLLVGSGIAVGYGVLSHELGLAGHLARRLSALTGRGTVVTVIADPDLGLADVSELLDEAQLARCDALLLTLGGAEAATLASPTAWRRALDGVLDSIDALAFTGLHVFVVGIPLLSLIPGAFGSIARRRAVLLNEQSALACAARSGTTFVPLDLTDTAAAGVLNRTTYLDWATQIAAGAASILTDAALVVPRPVAADEPGRQRAVDAMRSPNAAVEAELSEVLRSARDLFGVDTVAVNIIDGPVQRVRHACGVHLDSLPREESLCDATILEPDGLVVPDVLIDPRFRGRAQVEPERGIRFYAGYPIEAPAGERVGAFCLLDSRPRAFSASDLTLLRELALQAQRILLKHGQVVNPG